MGRSLVVLPSRIPANLFASLNCVNDDIRRSIVKTYKTLEKIGLTDADTPIRAVRQIFTRQADTQQVNIKSLLKMFQTYAGRCVFNPPVRDNYDAKGRQLDARTANTFEAMELAVEIARSLSRLDERIYRPESFYSKAASLLENERRAKVAYFGAHGKQ